MPQFDVFRNANPSSRAAYPLLVDVQTDLLSGIDTRAVIPLCPASFMKGQLLGTLTPIVEIDGKEFALVTPQLAGISVKQLGAKAANLGARRQEIIAALGFLITGI